MHIKFIDSEQVFKYKNGELTIGEKHTTKNVKRASNKEIEEGYFKALEDSEIPEFFKPQPYKTGSRL